MLSPTVCNPHISITHSTTVVYQNIAITDWQQTAPTEKSSKFQFVQVSPCRRALAADCPPEKSSKRDEWKYLISRHTEKSHLLDCRQNDGFDAKRAGSSIPQKIYVLDNKENTFQTICWT